MLFQFKKKMTSEMLKITVLYHSYLYAGKIFEHLVYNVTYDFLSDNNLLSPNQTRFTSGDSCINQLLSINHETLNAFDKGLEVRAIFLNISKAFDKVCHDGLIFKLCQIVISGNINILRGFLRNRKQRVVLNGQCSSWTNPWTFTFLDTH